MNHKFAHRTKDYKTATTLVVVATLAAVLIASTAAIGTGHMALASNSTKTKDNDGISISTHTKQKQECQTAGATSLVTASCIAASTNLVNNTGGVLR